MRCRYSGEESGEVNNKQHNQSQNIIYPPSCGKYKAVGGAGWRNKQ